MNIKMKKILIAEDEELNRDILLDIFADQYEAVVACDGEEAIQKIEEHGKSLSIILLDLVMPKKTGLDVLEYLNENKLIETIPVVMITGEATVDTDLSSYELGVADIIYKPFSAKVINRRVLNLIELYENRVSIEEKLAKRTEELRESKEKLKKNNEFLVNALSSVVEFRNTESGEHVNRVKKFTGILLKYVMKIYKEYHLTEQQIELMVNASALHDIGKIAIPDSILMKPGRFTPEEFDVMKTHTTQGCQILEKFKQEDNQFYQYCYDICRYHHERYDGKGYPDGISGEDIPIWAQVVAVADVFDALVSKRVYKSAYAVQEAERMIMEGECGTFSDKILDCFQMAKSELFDLVEKDMSFADAGCA